MQTVAARSRFVAGVHLGSGRNVLADPALAPGPTEALGRLRSLTVELATHRDLTRVHIQTKFNQSSSLDRGTFLRTLSRLFRYR